MPFIPLPPLQAHLPRLPYGDAGFNWQKDMRLSTGSVAWACLNEARRGTPEETEVSAFPPGPEATPFGL